MHIYYLLKGSTIEILGNKTQQLTIYSDFFSWKGFDSQYLFPFIPMPEFSCWGFFLIFKMS